MPNLELRLRPSVRIVVKQLFPDSPGLRDGIFWGSGLPPLSAVAEFERELIRERVRSGLANARAKGKRLGRPCATARQVDKGLSLIKQGVTYQAAAKQSGVSISTLLRAHRKTRAV
ncbi:recombinase family protein [Acidithiobacillus ferriphilus]|uniref:recombinase family protein n=1 Tax=Acidithiobacillus ferriphilus TaxID=1689834 RepID=UPI001C077490